MKLTRKQESFVRHLITNPKASATEAASQSYDVKSREVAATIAKENLRKPQIMAILGKHDVKAQKALVEGLEAERNVYRFNGDSKSYELVGVEKDHQSRLRAADSILDRLHGKATQRIEQHSTSVNLNLSLQDISE